MSKQKFNLGEWRRDTTLTPRDEVEIVISRIETASLDLTSTYNDWRDLGFALAQGLGEEGRTFYHRLSRFYSGYQSAETDKQYTACLHSRGHGITLNTFFHQAKLAGVDINTRPLPNCHIATLPKAKDVAISPVAGADRTPPGDDFPTFPDEIYASMPRLLSDVCSYGISAEDTDMLLLGALTVLSSCLTQISGIYGQRQVYPNLYLFVGAQASAGKGRLTLCRHLVDVVHADLRRQNVREWEEYRREKSLYEKSKRKEGGDEPCQPPVRMLFIPANSSATALFQTLNDNEGQALMFETEGDTLTTTFRSEHGNYSDGLRKAFHHETIAYNRRKDREYVEISMPRLSVLLSGTPRQIGALIPDAENGLFSRFLFYSLPLRPVWNDVFACNGEDTLDSCFLRLGGRFFQFYLRLKKTAPLRFTLTATQQVEFNRFFNSMQQQGLQCFGSDMLASVRRLGLTAYRICMVFSSLRLMDYEGDTPLPATLCCRDDDFHTTLLMMEVLLHHTGLAYEGLQADTKSAPRRATVAEGDQRERRLLQLFEGLPESFNRAGYQNVARTEGIPARTADRYIIELCNQGRLQKLDHDAYGKTGK
ncbi:DUF3987 domain-containing protein [Bacteroides oleiciplenus]|uniref:Primase C-terminal 2 domain-containing protein n=1 Tax=Bacteroides oleiciplenus YIT 12058 TaxID=742727 RepID=K9E488_9BACE|nr:DUF3987 domain-containing protein [Bacteroides oleiciplenus]EKU91498.1 hypothetical protein HMPREF9447_01334 [Bacteroides oleiciplenus YIT 12058]